MQRTIIDITRFNSSAPVLARAAGRAAVGSMNFSIVALLQSAIRAEKLAPPPSEPGEEEPNGIDALNDAMAAAADSAETARVRAEQGFATAQTPLEIAGKLKLIARSIAANLLEHADRKRMITDPSKTLPDTWHVAPTFEESFAYQLSLLPRLNEAQARAEAKAIGVTYEEIMAVQRKNHERQQGQLRENRDEILYRYKSLPAYDHSGNLLGLDQVETAFDTLPAIYKLRIAAAVDRGLFNARDREITNHLIRRMPDAAGNIALIDGERRMLLELVSQWTKSGSFQQEIEEAVKQGQQLPQFSPEPKVQKPDEADEAKAAHAAKAKAA